MTNKKKVVNKKVSKKKVVKKPIPVMVAILNRGHISTKLTKQLMEILGDSIVNKKYNIDFRFSSVTCVDYNRNTIAQMFLDSKNKWLLMMDEDNPCLKNPLDLIERNKDIIIYPTFMFKTDDGGQPVINYNVFKKEGKMWRAQRMTPNKPFMQYDAGGTGCILIKRRVLKAIKRPFLSKLKPNGTRDVGMDLWFCERARKAGFKLWADWTYVCEHYKEIELINVARMILNQAGVINKGKSELKLLKSK